MNLSSPVIPPWVKIGIRIAPWLGLLLASSALLLTRATLSTARAQHALELSQLSLKAKTQELEWSQRLSTAQGTYLQTFKNLSKVKEHSDEQTKAFAATPAGAVSCLTADRMREIAAHQAALEAASTAGGSDGAVSPGGDPTP